MPANFLPANDAKYAQWLSNFVQEATLNAATLGVSAQELVVFQSEADTLAETLLQAHAARAAAKAATAEKDAARQTSESHVRVLARRVQADDAISDDVRRFLGLPVHSKSTRRVLPNTPQALVAKPFANGINTLKWRPNGNRRGVMYVVEASRDGMGAWKQVGVSTQMRFSHTGCVPGETLYYRVRAQRNAKLSAPSNEASVYESTPRLSRAA